MHAPRSLAPTARNPRVQASPIYRWRRRYNQTRAALSRLTGIAPRSIYDYERGQVLPSPKTVVRLARALHASPWRLGANLFANHYRAGSDVVEKDGSLSLAFLQLGVPAEDYLLEVVELASEDQELMRKMLGPALRQLDAGVK